MEDEDSSVVPLAPSYKPKGDNVNSCTVCNRLLDAARRIIDMSTQKRDHGFKAGPKRQLNGLEPVSEIGSFEETLADSNCENHQDFVRSKYLKENFEDPSLRFAEKRFKANWNAESDRAILTEEDESGWFNQEVLILSYEPYLSILPCMERPRDEGFISIDLMREWISSCEMNHKTSCCIPTLPSITLAWVVDTTNLCLVPAEYGTRYIALSYVWGQTKMVKTTQETIRSLQVTGALSETSDLKVPRVIRHAISLASQLGQRYLWIDSLCIMQDDIESLDLHIRYMASIYEAALFTIVVADGVDAEHGILGLKGVSEPRKLPNPGRKLSKGLGMRLRGVQNIFNSPWGHRAWTLQEHIFSKRKLVFVHGSVQWICQESRCFEDLCQESISNRKKKQRYFREQELESVGEIALKYPMISQTEELLAQYTARTLTFGNDIIRAIESVFTAYGEAYPSGFFLGLPLDFFDQGLLWCHVGKYDTENAPRPKRRAVASHDTQPPFPSWTWAGWVGALCRGTWFAATYIKDANETPWSGKRCSTIPMLEWRYRSDGDGTEWPIPRQSEAYAYKLKFMGKKDGLPLGWKYERDPPPPIKEDKLPKQYRDEDKDAAAATTYYYSHDSAPGIKFWHPVPISIGMQGGATTPINGRLLCASTQSGHLWVTTVKQGRLLDAEAAFEAGDPRSVRLFNNVVIPEAVLVDIEGKVVGDLDISDEDGRDLVESLDSQPDEARCLCEMVAISKGHESVHPMEPGKETFTFYNVLWIKWEDGIAYRRGVGRVKRETWETLELEDIDLVLG